jgi:transcriptional regulator with PAS, ATPase and Fis domain
MHATGPDGQKMPLTQAYPMQLQKDADDIMAGLTPAQQRMFGAHVGATMAQFNNEVAAHSAQQLGVWRATVNNDTLTSAANSVASALPQMGTPQFDVMSNTASLNARGAINGMMVDKGVISLDKDGKPVFADDNARTVYDTESKALLGKYVGTIVQAGVQNQQAPQALKYLESQKSFMAPDDYARAHEMVVGARHDSDRSG